MHKITETIAFILVFLNSMAQEPFIDERDGQTYNTIIVNDSVVWMAENLRYNLPGAKVCAGNEAEDEYESTWNPLTGDTCAFYYTYKEAQNVCPSGWHLPEEREWDMLIENFGGHKKAGNKLKANGVWVIEGDDTDGIQGSGFNAMPRGFINHKGNLTNSCCDALWWSDSNIKTTFWGMSALSFELKDESNKVGSCQFDINMRLSVRCVKDD